MLLLTRNCSCIFCLLNYYFTSDILSVQLKKPMGSGLPGEDKFVLAEKMKKKSGLFAQTTLKNISLN